MTDPNPQPLRQRRQASPWMVALVVTCVTVVSFALVGPMIGFFIAFPFYDGTMFEFLADISDPVGKEDLKMLLMIIQGAATFFGLAIIPAIFWRSLTHKPILGLVREPPVKSAHLVLILGIVIFSFGFLSVFIEWNSNLDIPDGAFENWARATEDKAAEITKFLLSFSNVGQYLIAVLVIAILPGIGEEIVFRGFLQPAFQKSFKNVHAGIWVAAVFFSAMHLQFYGFFPRILLGALFGYLYYWSGNLIVPIFAHFLNNFIQVSMIYLGLIDMPGMETEDPTAMPWYGVAISTAVCGLLLYRFRAIQPKPVPDDIPA